MERSNRPRRTLGALRAELVFSGESLRINGRGLLLGLVVGLLVGAWGGLFARLLEGAALVRQQTTWAMFLLPLAAPWRSSCGKGCGWGRSFRIWPSCAA